MQKQTIPLRVLNGPAAPPAGAAQKFWNIVDEATRRLRSPCTVKL